MKIHRRGFFGAAAATAAAARTPVKDLEALRESFPRVLRETYLDAAAHCPLGRHTAEGIRRYLDFHMYGPGEGRGDYVAQAMQSVRSMFARLINARPSEIALVHCTKAGENIVIQGLDIQASGGNVVTNDLHYAGSLHNYIGHRKHGMDVRIVKARNWAIDVRDMDAAIDRKTRLVAITPVSNVNGHIEDTRAISDIAHSRGAFVYADIIQAAGIVPIDVRALGIDFAACSNYKWLQGVRGAGFLYVREELQGKLLRDLLYPGYVYFNYPPWVERPDPAKEEFPYREPAGAARYEPGNINYAGYVGQYETFRVMHAIGLQPMFEHTLKLVNRLKKELPESAYRLITPPHQKTPIATFIPLDIERTRARLKRAGVQVTLIGNRMRVSPAPYNNERDIDRLLEALT